jgi:hypothetical protein
MTALRSRTCMCSQGAVMVFTETGNVGLCPHACPPGVKLEESLPAFAFSIVAFALSSPVS